jgi:hypothetical protein
VGTKLVGYVACMGEMRSLYRTVVRKPEGKSDLDIDGRTILIWILVKIGCIGLG